MTEMLVSLDNPKRVELTQEEFIELVARMLFKADFPLRRWRQSKAYLQKEYVKKAKNAWTRIEREGNRL